MSSAATHRIPAGTRFDRHAHECVHVCAVLEGGFLETVSKEAVDVGPGQIRLSPPTAHRIRFGGSGARCLLLELDAEALPTLSRSRFFARDPELDATVRAVDRTLARDDASGPVAVEGLATELTALLLRRLDGRATPAPAWLRPVREMLHDEPVPPPVGVLATRAGVHRVHMARVFREHLGVTVSAYARRLRLERALRLLAESDLPIAAVAFRAGFADQSHLTRAVRAALGTTPAALRGRSMLPVFKPRRARRG